jgi:hypothetical protein
MQVDDDAADKKRSAVSSSAIYRLTRPIPPLIRRLPSTVSSTSASASAASSAATAASSPPTAEMQAFSAKLKGLTDLDERRKARLVKSAYETRLDVKMSESGQAKTADEDRLFQSIAAEEDRAMPWRQLFVDAAEIGGLVKRPFFGLQSAFLAVQDADPETAEQQATFFVRCYLDVLQRYGWPDQAALMKTIQDVDWLAPQFYVAFVVFKQLNEIFRSATAVPKFRTFAIELENCFLQLQLDNNNLTDDENESALQSMQTLIDHPKLSVVRSVPVLIWMDWQNPKLENQFGFFDGFRNYLIDSEPIGVERIKDCVLYGLSRHYPELRQRLANEFYSATIKPKPTDSLLGGSVKQHLQQLFAKTIYPSYDIKLQQHLQAAARSALVCLTNRLSADKKLPVVIGSSNDARTAMVDEPPSFAYAAGPPAGVATSAYGWPIIPTAAVGFRFPPPASTYPSKKGGCVPTSLNRFF